MYHVDHVDKTGRFCADSGIYPDFGVNVDNSDKKTDPANDPEFQKVVRRFLDSPPRPHKPPQKKVGKTNGGVRRQSRRTNPTSS